MGCRQLARLGGSDLEVSLFRASGFTSGFGSWGFVRVRGVRASCAHAGRRGMFGMF